MEALNWKKSPFLHHMLKHHSSGLLWSPITGSSCLWSHCSSPDCDTDCLLYFSSSKTNSKLLNVAEKGFCHLAPPSSPTPLLSTLSHISMYQTYLTMSNSSSASCSLSSCLCLCSPWCLIFLSSLISLSNSFNSSLYEFLLESSVSVTFWQEIAHSKWITWEAF